MTDIVDRLNGSLSVGYSELRKEAAVTITRLRASLEAAEKERANANAAAAGIALKAQKLEDDRAIDTQRMAILVAKMNEAERERDALRAKIAEMEQQEPIGEMLEVSPHNYELRWYRPVPFGAKLCVLPGVKPTPSINEGVRKVTLDFRWESEAQHHIPTIEIEFDPVSPDSPNDAKGWQDRDRIASMLSPEAKP